MINLPKLFDKYRISFRDRGKNVSKGNIVLSCVFCNKTNNQDPGEHLSVNVSTGEMFCYRNPKHKGFVAQLLRELKIPEAEYKNLIFKETDRQVQAVDKDFSLINYFQPAQESEEAILYLERRLFTQPVEASKKFKLMVDREGKWSGRIIIPLTVGWTGRAMRPHIEPRYDAYTTEDGFFLYKQKSTSCLILEGAIDAMRIASVSSQFDVVGKCGNRLSAALLNTLRESNYLSIYNVPDGDVNFDQHFEETKILRSYCTRSDVKRLAMPSGVKDFGIMREVEARQWLFSSCHM